MSSALYVLPPDRPRTVAEMRALLQTGDSLEPAPAAEFLGQLHNEEVERAARPERSFRVDVPVRRGRGGFTASTVGRFVLPLAYRWPSTADDPEPLWRPALGGRALVIDTSRPRLGSDDVRSMVVELATEHGLRVYDPESDEISGVTRRGLLQRLRRR